MPIHSLNILKADWTILYSRYFVPDVDPSWQETLRHAISNELPQAREENQLVCILKYVKKRTSFPPTFIIVTITKVMFMLCTLCWEISLSF